MVKSKTAMLNELCSIVNCITASLAEHSLAVSFVPSHSCLATSHIERHCITHRARLVLTPTNIHFILRPVIANVSPSNIYKLLALPFLGLDVQEVIAHTEPQNPTSSARRDQTHQPHHVIANPSPREDRGT